MADTESTSAALRRVEQERDIFREKWVTDRAERDEALDVVAEMRAERDGAYAELASARTELAAMLAAAAERVGRLVYSYDAWSCLRCGNRYHRDFTDHPCGFLTPVTVTITRRTDEPVAVIDPGEGLLT